MKSLEEIVIQCRMLSAAFNLPESERKLAKVKASKFLDDLCQEFSELSAPARSSIRKQLNQDLVKFLHAARHLESMELKRRENNGFLETSSSSIPEAGTV